MLVLEKWEEYEVRLWAGIVLIECRVTIERKPGTNDR